MGNKGNIKTALIFLKEVFENKEFDLLDSIIHPEYSIYFTDLQQNEVISEVIPPKLDEQTGIEGVKIRTQEFTTQFSDLKFDILEQVAENDTVVLRYILSMTQSGTWYNFPPSGIRVNISGFHMFKFRDEKIIAIDFIISLIDIIKQLGKSFTSNNETKQIKEYLDNVTKFVTTFQ